VDFRIRLQDVFLQYQVDVAIKQHLNMQQLVVVLLTVQLVVQQL
jgi:hypothetical protein